MSPLTITSSPLIHLDNSHSGYSSEYFVDAANIQDFNCGVCLQICADPVRTTNENLSVDIGDPSRNCCWHLFCRTCINSAVNFQNKCPLCRKELQSYQTTGDIHVQKQISKLYVNCLNEYNGQKCSWNGIFGIEGINLKQHQKECLFEEVCCSNNSTLCTFKGNRIQLKDHLSKCTFRKVSCQLCSEMMFDFEIEEHQKNQCSESFVNCVYCGVHFRRKIIPIHWETNCTQYIITCPLQRFGCDEYFPRSQLNQHFIQFKVEHQNLVTHIQNMIAEYTALVSVVQISRNMLVPSPSFYHRYPYVDMNFCHQVKMGDYVDFFYHHSSFQEWKSGEVVSHGVEQNKPYVIIKFYVDYSATSTSIACVERSPLLQPYHKMPRFSGYLFLNNRDYDIHQFEQNSQAFTDFWKNKYPAFNPDFVKQIKLGRGCQVDIYVQDQTWYPGTIIDETQDSYVIEFTNFSKTFIGLQGCCKKSQYLQPFCTISKFVNESNNNNNTSSSTLTLEHTETSSSSTLKQKRKREKKTTIETATKKSKRKQQQTEKQSNLNTQ